MMDTHPIYCGLDCSLFKRVVRLIIIAAALFALGTELHASEDPRAALEKKFLSSHREAKRVVRASKGLSDCLNARKIGQKGGVGDPSLVDFERALKECASHFLVYIGAICRQLNSTGPRGCTSETAEVKTLIDMGRAHHLAMWQEPNPQARDVAPADSAGSITQKTAADVFHVIAKSDLLGTQAHGPAVAVTDRLLAVHCNVVRHASNIVVQGSIKSIPAIRSGLAFLDPAGSRCFLYSLESIANISDIRPWREINTGDEVLVRYPRQASAPETGRIISKELEGRDRILTIDMQNSQDFAGAGVFDRSGRFVALIAKPAPVAEVWHSAIAAEDWLKDKCELEATRFDGKSCDDRSKKDN